MSVSHHYVKRKSLAILFLALTLLLSQYTFFPSSSLAASNLAVGKGITADGYTQVYAPTNANDGNVGTYWEGRANAYPNWIRVDLASASLIDQVVVKLPTAWGARTQAFSILGSTDDVNYSTIVASANYSFTAGINSVTINFTATTARYVKLNFTANSGSTGAQVSEFEVYGTAVTDPQTPTPPGSYEAEAAVLSGGAKVNTNHTGYTGTGFVDGYWTQGASTQFTVTAAAAGNYNVALKYSNANGASKTLSVYVNGTKIKQTSLANLANWDTWSAQTEVLALNAGNNTIAYKYDASDSGNINLDSINVAISTDPTTPTSGTNLALNKPITASSSVLSFVATNANDGSLTTYWEGNSGSYPNTLTVSLGGNATTSSVVLKLNPDSAWSTRTQTIEVLGHNQSTSTFSSLVAAATYTFNPATGNTVTIPVTAAVSDIQLKITANSGSSAGQIAEFQVLGTPAPNPDLTVTNLTWTPTGTINEGTPVNFSAEVTNAGTGASPNVAHKVSFRVNGTEVAVGSANLSLAVNGKTTITASAPWSSSFGTYTVAAVVDPDNTIIELNKTNNSLSKSITLAQLPGPDLIVQSVTWSPTNPQPGNLVTFTVTAKNQGKDPANGTINAQVVVGTITLNGSLTGGLAAGATGVISIAGSWTAVNGLNNITATVDPTNIITEVNENNNTLSTSIGVSTAGPALPYVEIQAESANTNGTIIGPSRFYPSLAGEASERRAVTLTAQGQYVEFTVPQNANSIVMRYSIPDNAAGTGITAPLALYINNVKQPDLSLTSKYGWAYGGYPFNNNPVDSRPHHFYDEVHRLVSQMTPGTKVKVQVDAGNNAGSYTIDLMDFEQVAPAATQPAGSLSLVADFGADPTGAVDATTATQNAVNTASSQGKVLWVPAGTYTVKTQIHVNNVTIKGAGMWYSTFHFTTQTGDSEGFYGNYNTGTASTNVHLSDFAIFGEVVVRNDNDQINGIGGALSNSTIDNLWIEHTKCGMWLDGPMDNLKIKGVRIRNQNADGVNFHLGVTNSSVTQSFLRNTGDDGLAMWSDARLNIADANNSFTFNRVELPVLANGIALYGGTNNNVTDNYVADQQAEGGGIHVGNRFSPVTPVSGIINISRNIIIRCGSEDYYQGWNFGTGALWFYALDAAMTATINVDDNKIIDSNYEAIHFIGSSITNITFNRDQIIGAGTFAIESRSSGGSATFNNVTATGLGRGSFFGSANGFQVIQGPGNTGWSATPILYDPYPTPIYGN